MIDNIGHRSRVLLSIEEHSNISDAKPVETKEIEGTAFSGGKSTNAVNTLTGMFSFDIGSILFIGYGYALVPRPLIPSANSRYIINRKKGFQKFDISLLMRHASPHPNLGHCWLSFHTNLEK